MELLNKVLFYSLIFLLASLHLSRIKTELISHKSEKNHILQENRDKCENFFQKIFSEKKIKKDEIYKKGEDMNLVKVSKETEKKEKPIIKAERNENNLRKLADEDSYIIVHYGKDASYPNGFRTDAGSENLITKIMYNGNTFQYNSVLTIIAGTYIEIYISSSQTTISSFFKAGTSSEYETNCANIKLIDLSHLKNSFRIMTNFFTNCNGIKALDMSMINLASVTSSSDFFKGITSLIYLNIYNTELGDNLKQTLKNYFNDDYGQNLIVCQSEEILTVTKFEYKCCDFLAGECEPESEN